MYTCNECNKKFSRADNLKRHTYQSCKTFEEDAPANKKIKRGNNTGNIFFCIITINTSLIYSFYVYLNILLVL